MYKIFDKVIKYEYLEKLERGINSWEINLSSGKNPKKYLLERLTLPIVTRYRNDTP